MNKAMSAYNSKWQYPYDRKTQTLYAKAATSPAFGCHLQNEVLVRLGDSVVGHKTHKHYGKAAQAFIDWMIS